MHLSLCKAGNGMIESCRITLENVTVTDVNLDDVAEAAYEFRADKVKFQYWEQAASGIKGAESRMGWDIKTPLPAFSRCGSCLHDDAKEAKQKPYPSFTALKQ